jgi:hypothetical protein
MASRTTPATVAWDGTQPGMQIAHTALTKDPRGPKACQDRADYR